MRFIVSQADGRDVQLSRLYPLFIGSRVLGSTMFRWFYDTSSPYYSQNSLTSAFAVACLALSIVAYDYQVPETGMIKNLIS